MAGDTQEHAYFFQGLKIGREKLSESNDTTGKCVLCDSGIKSDPNQEIQSDYYCPNCITKLTIKCPVCGSVASFSQDERSSRYFGYHCSKCKGTWFDTDVLEFRPDGSMFFMRYKDNSE